MNADTAKRIAAETEARTLAQTLVDRLTLELGQWRATTPDMTEEQFFQLCRRSERDAYKLARALLEAARMPTREQMAVLLEKEIPERDIYGEWHPKAFTRLADSIIAAWSKPQADREGR